MIDIVGLLLVVAAALGYRKVTNDSVRNNPEASSGDSNHPDIPEVDYIPAVEISELDASCFLNSGKRHQQGKFAVKDATNTAN